MKSRHRSQICSITTFMPVLIIVSTHSTFAISGFFALNHDVTGPSLSSHPLCRACHYTGRWVDWVSQPSIKDFIVTPFAKLFCPLKAIIQGCSHPTTLHRICFLAVGAENSKWINWTDSSAGCTKTGNDERFDGTYHSIAWLNALKNDFSELIQVFEQPVPSTR